MTRPVAGLVTSFSPVGFGGIFLLRPSFPRAMPRGAGTETLSIRELRKELAAVRRQLQALDRRLRDQEQRLRDLAKASDHGGRGLARVYDALQLGEAPKKGDRGVVRDLQDSVERLEDYLLKTSDRIETIFSALKQHRELLVSVNKRVLDSGTKDRIRLELDVMKNTLSILSLNGVDFDASIVKDIESLRARLRQSEDLAVLERAKADIDKKFDGELKKYDLDAIWAKKKEIPGYR